MKISYYTVLHFDKDGVWVNFPDLGGCFSTGERNNVEQMAKEAMELYLHKMEVNKLPIPTPLSDISLGENQKAKKITIDFDVADGKLFCPKVVEFLDNDSSQV